MNVLILDDGSTKDVEAKGDVRWENTSGIALI